MSENRDYHELNGLVEISFHGSLRLICFKITIISKKSCYIFDCVKNAILKLLKKILDNRL